jgi:hypothetical protein
MWFIGFLLCTSVIQRLFAEPFRIAGLGIATEIASRLPLPIQQNIYHLAKLDSVHMDFTLEPDSLWVGYTVANDTEIVRRLPPGLELCPVRVFDDKTEPQTVLFFNYFRVNSTFLRGHRLEIVTVARDVVTDQKRFVIIDYFSDTISSDPAHPFKRANAKQMGTVSVDNTCGVFLDNKYMVLAQKTTMETKLSAEFAIGCNKNVFYAGAKPQLPNYMTFDEDAVCAAFKLDNVHVVNTLWRDTIGNSPPAFSFYFPHPLCFNIQTNKLWDQEECY